MVVVVPVPTVCLCWVVVVLKLWFCYAEGMPPQSTQEGMTPHNFMAATNDANLRPVWVYSLKQEEM